jgi:hypothetical protein
LQEILCILPTGGSVFLNALNLASGNKIINDLLPGNIERPADKLKYSSVIRVFEHLTAMGKRNCTLLLMPYLALNLVDCIDWILTV